MSAPKHSRLSPSKAYQWTTCTASIGYIEANRHRIPPDRAGAAAIEGSLAHLVAESILLNQPLPAGATKEMIRFGKQYADICRERIGPVQHCDDWAVERRVPLFYLPEEAGTIDFNACNRSGVHIVDYKYGYSKVESIGNKQMAIYAGSLITHEQNWVLWPRITDSTPVTMTIFQPRLENDIEVWETTWGDLCWFLAEEVKVHAHAILAAKPGKIEFNENGTTKSYIHDPALKFSPSEKTCKWCPMMFDCPARNQWMLDEFRDAISFDDEEGLVVNKQPSEIPANDLLAIWTSKKIILDFLDAVEEQIRSRTFSKEGMPGTKIVMSNGGHRYWTNPGRAAKALLEMGVPFSDVFDVLDTPMCSPAQAEKLTHHIKSKKMQELYALMAKPPGKPVMALENDPRPAWKADVLKDFGGLLEIDD